MVVEFAAALEEIKHRLLTYLTIQVRRSSARSSHAWETGSHHYQPESASSLFFHPSNKSRLIAKEPLADRFGLCVASLDFSVSSHAAT
jgi:hypothetical protein